MLTNHGPVLSVSSHLQVQGDDALMLFMGPKKVLVANNVSHFFNEKLQSSRSNDGKMEAECSH